MKNAAISKYKEEKSVLISSLARYDNSWPRSVKKNPRKSFLIKVTLHFSSAFSGISMLHHNFE